MRIRERKWLRWRLGLGGIAGILEVLCSGVAAQGATNETLHVPEPRVRELRLFSILMENDYVAHTDHDYSHGLALAWGSGNVAARPAGSRLRRLTEASRFLPVVGAQGVEHYWTFRLIQQIFTPRDIEADDPPAGQHPYGGLLYGQAGLHARRAKSQHDYALLLGMVGPSTQSDELYELSHEVIGSSEAHGWDTQLRDEPLVNFNYSHERRWVEATCARHFQWDLSSLVGAGVGTYVTGAAAGLSLRAGMHLPETYEGFGLRLGFSTDSLPTGSPCGERWGAYASCTVQGVALAHYMPHGNIWTSGRSVDTEPWIGVRRVGLHFYYAGLTLSQQWIEATNFYEAQEGDVAYGSMSLTFAY